MMMTPAPELATTSAICGSYFSPPTSLIIVAPALSAARAGVARLVSAEIGTDTEGTIAPIACVSRSLSSSAEIVVFR